MTHPPYRRRGELPLGLAERTGARSSDGVTAAELRERALERRARQEGRCAACWERREECTCGGAS